MNFDYSNDSTHYLEQRVQDTLDYPGVFEIAVTATTCRLMQLELIKRFKDTWEHHNQEDGQCFCNDCTTLLHLPAWGEQDGHQSRGDFGLLFFVGEYKTARLGSQCIRSGELTKQTFLCRNGNPCCSCGGAHKESFTKEMG